METAHQVRRLRLPSWVFVLAPPVAWLVQFEVAYVLVPPSRAPEHVGAIRWVSFAALLVAATSTFEAWRDLGRARASARPGERRSDADAWMAVAGVGLGVFFCLVIVAIVLMTWFLSPED